MSDHTHTPFTDRTSLSEARRQLRDHVEPHGRTEPVPLSDADGRTLAEHIAAHRNVPHYTRAAMDGYAVRAEDTFGAGDRSPATLRVTDDAVDPGETAPVHTGSELPAGADAVVMTEHAETVGDRIEVFRAVGEGANVAPEGEDVREGQHLFDAGHRLRPSDLGLLRSVGVETVAVHERPTVSVVPTGEELVRSDPAPGEVVETNGLTVSRLASRWGAEPDYGDVVTDDPDALREAIDDAASADLVVTIGGSSVGARDLLPEVVDDLGEVFVHGVGIKPGHPVALGRVDETPVLMLPGYPVSCIITAVQLLRPAIKWTGGMPLDPPPTVEARLDEKIHSEPGLRSFARVRLEERDGERVATAVRASGAGVLSSVALSDGWVVVPEQREGVDGGTTVTVEHWEWSP